MRSQRRVAVGILIALCGIAIGAGTELSWIRARGSRPAAGIRHAAITSVQHWSLQPTGSYLKSFAFVIVIAAALVFLGGVFGSRTLAGIFSAIALAAAIIWLALEAGKYSKVNLPFSDLRIGALLTAGAALVALASTVYLRRRPT
jgi:hypothetical protein